VPNYVEPPSAYRPRVVVFLGKLVEGASNRASKLNLLLRRQVARAKVKGVAFVMQRAGHVFAVKAAGDDEWAADAGEAIDQINPRAEHDRLEAIQNYVRFTGGLAGFQLVF